MCSDSHVLAVNRSGLAFWFPRRSRLDRTQIAKFGSPDFPVDKVLGPRTRAVLAKIRSADTSIIKKRSSGDLSSAQILATGKQLSADQIQMIRDAANEPRAFYNGSPVFRRLPPEQDFAVQLRSDSDVLDLMIGLHNPSWGFYCGMESYQDWHWVGHIFKPIAKSAFPEYASESSKYVWRQGVIFELERTCRQHR
jgi:hypothetical protein